MQDQQKLTQIKDRIFGKGKESDLLTIWDHLMDSYGWIPFEEFKKLDAFLLWELIERIYKRNERKNSKYGIGI